MTSITKAAIRTTFNRYDRLPPLSFELLLSQRFFFFSLEKTPRHQLPDILTPVQRLHVMSQIHSSSTKPELRLRDTLCRLEDTVFRVAQEIRANGELFNKRKEDRRIEIERWRRERAAKKCGYDTLTLP